MYLGTPDEAVPPLRALHRAGYNVVLVVSRADARRRRGGGASPSPVKAAALELGLPVSADLADIETSGAQLGVVVAYGRIIPAELLDVVPMVNLHFSKLPRWRGAAPVERALLAGDTETAVAIMAMEAGLDTGPIYAEDIVPISPIDTAESLRARLVDSGTALLLHALEGGLVNEPTPQVGEPDYAHKITSEDRRIDWTTPAALIDAQVRVGRAHTVLRGERFLIWSARPGPSIDLPAGTLTRRDGRFVVATVDGSLELLEVQPANKPRMAVAAWWNGAQPEGEVLGR